MIDHQRRSTDSAIGRLMAIWPVIAGLFLVLISLGGYLATVRIQSDHLEKIDQWIEQQRTTNAEQSKLSTHLSDMLDAQDHRLNSMQRTFDDFVSIMGIHEGKRRRGANAVD